MKTVAIVLALATGFAILGVEAYAPSMSTPCCGFSADSLSTGVYPLLTYVASIADPCGKTVKPIQDAKKAAVGTFAAFTLASAVFFTPPADAALPPTAAFFSSSTTVSEKVLREGVYFDYEVDVQPQKYDDARSTFKPASETKSNKGAYLQVDVSNLACPSFGLLNTCTLRVDDCL
jgi:hypothetical protein